MTVSRDSSTLLFQDIQNEQFTPMNVNKNSSTFYSQNVQNESSKVGLLEEILVSIFKLLSFQDASNASLVCWRWQKLFLDPEQGTTFGQDLKEMKKIKNLLEYIPRISGDIYSSHDNMWGSNQNFCFSSIGSDFFTYAPNNEYTIREHVLFSFNQDNYKDTKGELELGEYLPIDNSRPIPQGIISRDFIRLNKLNDFNFKLKTERDNRHFKLIATNIKDPSKSYNINIFDHFSPLHEDPENYSILQCLPFSESNIVLIHRKKISFWDLTGGYPKCLGLADKDDDYARKSNNYLFVDGKIINPENKTSFAADIKTKKLFFSGNSFGFANDNEIKFFDINDVGVLEKFNFKSEKEIKIFTANEKFIVCGTNHSHFVLNPNGETIFSFNASHKPRHLYGNIMICEDKNSLIFYHIPSQNCIHTLNWKLLIRGYYGFEVEDIRMHQDKLSILLRNLNCNGLIIQFDPQYFPQSVKMPSINEIFTIFNTTCSGFDGLKNEKLKIISMFINSKSSERLAMPENWQKMENELSEHLPITPSHFGITVLSEDMISFAPLFEQITDELALQTLPSVYFSFTSLLPFSKKYIFLSQLGDFYFTSRESNDIDARFSSKILNIINIKDPAKSYEFSANYPIKKCFPLTENNIVLVHPEGISWWDISDVPKCYHTIYMETFGPASRVGDHLIVNNVIIDLKNPMGAKKNLTLNSHHGCFESSILTKNFKTSEFEYLIVDKEGIPSIKWKLPEIGGRIYPREMNKDYIICDFLDSESKTGKTFIFNHKGKRVMQFDSQKSRDNYTYKFCSHLSGDLLLRSDLDSFNIEFYHIPTRKHIYTQNLCQVLPDIRKERWRLEDFKLLNTKLTVLLSNPMKEFKIVQFG